MNAANPTTTSFGGARTNRGWIFYDGECPLCVAAANKSAPWLRRHHFDLAPLQTPWARDRLGLNPCDPLTEMKYLTEAGNIFGGADALLQIARRIWWAWPLFALAQIPGPRILLRRIYRRVAAKRHCSKGVCAFPEPPHRRHAAFLEMP